MTDEEKTKTEELGNAGVNAAPKKKIEKSAPKTEKKTQGKAPAKKEAKPRKEKPAKEKKQETRKVVVDKAVDPFETIQFVLMTEKCVRMIEPQNKLVFVVRRQARKKQIRKAVENAFQSPVAGVTTMIDQKGRKRAFVKFGQAGAAGDIAVRLGII